MKLGKLRKIDLREQWKHEALDFTRWLAEPENLKALGDEIGLDVTLIQIEAGVGRFSADILAQDETSGSKIVIENQLEKTDHSHLGQALTYAAGHEAEYIVWIVKDAREEHRQAVDWLNDHTDEKINIFLICVELWQIDTSAPAPKFVIVSRPNNWTKTVRGNGSSSTSNTKLFQLEFWQQLSEFAISNHTPIKPRAPTRGQYYCIIPIGRSDCHISLTMLIKDNLIGCQIYIPKSKQLFNAYYSNKEAIENELKIEELSWQDLPNPACRIQASYKFDFENQLRDDAFTWLLQTANTFKSVFSKSWPSQNQS